MKETLEPVVRDRDSLRATRFVSSNRADTTRKLVAVGTLSDAFMFDTMRAAAPRRGVADSSTALAAGRAAAAAVVGAADTAATLGNGER